jgi:hypothetical protein
VTAHSIVFPRRDGSDSFRAKPGSGCIATRRSSWRLRLELALRWLATAGSKSKTLVSTLSLAVEDLLYSFRHR